MNLAAKLKQAIISLRSRNQLETGANGLGDAAAACALCLFEKVLLQ